MKARLFARIGFGLLMLGFPFMTPEAGEPLPLPAESYGDPFALEEREFPGPPPKLGYENRRVATVFIPGGGPQAAASKGFDSLPQNIDWQIVVQNASCNCFWDQCVYSRWSACYQYLCIDPGC